MACDIDNMSELEKITEKFNLRLLEVIGPGEIIDGNYLLRFDFMAKSDSGDYFIAGETQYALSTKMTPHEFTDALRTIADRVDDHWEKLFPSASTSKL